MDAPTLRLAAALSGAALTPAERQDFKARLGIAGSAGGLIGRMTHGAPVPVDVFLALHAARGWDPLTSAPPEGGLAEGGLPPLPGRVNWGFFALCLRLARGDMSMRAAAQLVGISARLWCHAEAGRPVSVAAFLRLCALLERHPHALCAPEPGPLRFPRNINCNSNISAAA